MLVSHQPGSFVIHAKLPELGSGEVISSEKGTICIRFASGQRSFLIEAAQDYLSVTQEGPPAPQAAARARRSRAKTPKA